MQFCTINEAWGNKKNIETYDKHDTINKNKMETNMDDSTDSSIVETFIEQKKKKRRPKDREREKDRERQRYYTATEDSYYENFTDTIHDNREREKLISTKRGLIF